MTGGAVENPSPSPVSLSHNTELAQPFVFDSVDQAAAQEFEQFVFNGLAATSDSALSFTRLTQSTLIDDTPLLLADRRVTSGDYIKDRLAEEIRGLAGEFASRPLKEGELDDLVSWLDYFGSLDQLQEERRFDRARLRLLDDHVDKAMTAFGFPSHRPHHRLEFLTTFLENQVDDRLLPGYDAEEALSDTLARLLAETNPQARLDENSFESIRRFLAADGVIGADRTLLQELPTATGLFGQTPAAFIDYLRHAKVPSHVLPLSENDVRDILQSSESLSPRQQIEAVILAFEANRIERQLSPAFMTDTERGYLVEYLRNQRSLSNTARALGRKVGAVSSATELGGRIAKNVGMARDAIVVRLETLLPAELLDRTDAGGAIAAWANERYTSGRAPAMLSAGLLAALERVVLADPQMPEVNKTLRLADEKSTTVSPALYQNLGFADWQALQAALTNLRRSPIIEGAVAQIESERKEPIINPLLANRVDLKLLPVYDAEQTLATELARLLTETNPQARLDEKSLESIQRFLAADGVIGADRALLQRLPTATGLFGQTPAEFIDYLRQADVPSHVLPLSESDVRNILQASESLSPRQQIEAVIRAFEANRIERQLSPAFMTDTERGYLAEYLRNQRSATNMATALGRRVDVVGKATKPGGPIAKNVGMPRDAIVVRLETLLPAELLDRTDLGGAIAAWANERYISGQASAMVSGHQLAALERLVFATTQAPKSDGALVLEGEQPIHVKPALYQKLGFNDWRELQGALADWRRAAIEDAVAQIESERINTMPDARELTTTQELYIATWFAQGFDKTRTTDHFERNPESILNTIDRGAVEHLAFTDRNELQGFAKSRFPSWIFGRDQARDQDQAEAWVVDSAARHGQTLSSIEGEVASGLIKAGFERKTVLQDLNMQKFRLQRTIDRIASKHELPASIHTSQLSNLYQVQLLFETTAPREVLGYTPLEHELAKAVNGLVRTGDADHPLRKTQRMALTSLLTSDVDLPLSRQAQNVEMEASKYVRSLISTAENLRLDAGKPQEAADVLREFFGDIALISEHMPESADSNDAANTSATEAAPAGVGQRHETDSQPEAETSASLQNPEDVPAGPAPGERAVIPGGRSRDLPAWAQPDEAGREYGQWPDFSSSPGEPPVLPASETAAPSQGEDEKADDTGGEELLLPLLPDWTLQDIEEWSPAPQSDTDEVGIPAEKESDDPMREWEPFDEESLTFVPGYRPPNDDDNSSNLDGTGNNILYVNFNRGGNRDDNSDSGKAAYQNLPSSADQATHIAEDKPSPQQPGKKSPTNLFLDVAGYLLFKPIETFGKWLRWGGP